MGEEVKGHVRELFASIQGEGIKIGCRQNFIRFLGCNLSCNYCDTPESQAMKGGFVFGGEIFDNPVSVAFLVERVTEPEVAITGGEPLLQPLFLQRLCKVLKAQGHQIYLDTNGTLPDELAMVVDLVDTISLDFKIPTATGRPKLWGVHEKCLGIATAKQVFVKIVINENVLPSEIDTTCDIIEHIDRGVPLVIQPVFGHHIPQLLDIQKRAMERIESVMILPQIHKYLGMP